VIIYLQVLFRMFKKSMHPKRMQVTLFYFRYYLENLHKKIGSFSWNVLTVVYNLTANYYLFGRSVMFTDSEVLELVEHALCPLQYSVNNSLEAAIVEPSVAWSCYHFFKDLDRPIEDYCKEIIANISISATSCGVFWEFSLIPEILRYFSCDNLYNHKYFKERPDARKHWLKGAKLDCKNLKHSRPQIGSASKKETLVSYLKGRVLVYTY
jgi:hypothetical protein